MRARPAWIVVGAVAVSGAVALAYWAEFPARTCEAGSYVLRARGPYRIGAFVGESIACDLTLRKRGVLGLFASKTSTSGGGACTAECRELVKASGAQILVDETWYSDDGGASFSSVYDRLRPGLLKANDYYVRLDLEDDQTLRVRAWDTFEDADEKKRPPRSSFVTRNGGRSWDPE